MLSKKLKVLSAIVLAAFVLVMTQMPIASAKSVDDSPFRLASLVQLGNDWLAFFSFTAPAADDKTGDADKLLASAACQPAPANLVSWYRGENNANDSQGANNGVISGATFAAGQVGQAFNFDGADDSIRLPLTQTFQNITLETWVKPLAVVSDPINQELIIGQASFGSQIVVIPGTEGGMRVKFQFRDSVNSFVQLTSTRDIPLSSWSHLSGTYDGTTLKLYINGVLNAQLNPPNTAVLTCGTPYFIGGFQAVTDCNNNTNQPSQFFNGLIDEASIYSRSLTDAEIQSIFNAGSAGKCVSTCTPPPSNGVSWFRAENNANDSIGTNNGTISGATFAAGKVGQAFSFDGVNDSVEAANSSSLNITNSLTIEAWVNPNGDGVKPIVSKWNDLLGNVNTSYAFTIENGNSIRLSIRGNDEVFSNAASGVAIPSDTWTHVAGVFDSQARTMRIFVNGAPSGFTSTTTFTTIKSTTEPLLIGAADFGGNARLFMRGKIDEPSIYNRALSDAEIQSIFNAGSAGKCASDCTPSPVNQISWYRGENNANDAQRTNQGTLQNNLGFAAGKVGQAFNFNAAGQAVQVPDSSSLDLTNQATLEAWVSPSQFGTGNGAGPTTMIINKEGASAANGNLAGYSLMYRSDGRFSVRVCRGSLFNPICIEAMTNVFGLNSFLHVAGTYDGQTVRSFVNGVPQFSASFDSPQAIGVNAAPLTIGGSAANADFFGLIDEPTIYSRALSQAEIQAIFNAGSAGKCASNCVASPINQVSWWRGESSGSDSQATNNGTMQNGADFAPGKIGSGFRFDADNEHLLVPASPSLNVGANGSLTLEAWVKPTSPNPGGSGYGPIFEWGSGGGVQLGRFNNGVLFANVQDTSATNHFLQTAGNAIVPNQFQHVALTYSSVTGIGTIYVNGVVAATQNLGSFTPRTDTEMRLGVRGGSDSFNGIIDEAAIYNRALSQTEIQALFNADGAGKCEAAALQIAPTTANAATGGTVNFSGISGAAPYTFSILTNNSGGSINASTGVYTAGGSIGADTVRVTDSNNATANATVNVTAACVAGQKTWDGGGATNNWSDAANWTCDLIPSSGDAIIFNNTSTKNSTIDTNQTPDNVQINTGYTGTITQGAGATVAFNRYTQSSGTFACGGGLITFATNSGFNLSGGRFDCTASNINSLNGVFNLSGGVFDMPSGTFALGDASGSSSINRGANATLNHNNGTLLLRQSQLTFSSGLGTQDFNNVTVVSSNNGVSGTMRVLGALDLQRGLLSLGTVEAFGNVTVANTYGASFFGIGSATLKLSGDAARTVTLPAGMPARFNPIVLDAPNVLLNSSGAGTVFFERFTLNQGTFENGTTGFDLNSPFTQNGGTFTCGGGLINMTLGNGALTLNNGTFNCAASDMILSDAAINLNGGVFTAPAGTLTLSGSSLRRSSTAVFNHSNGTLRAIGGFNRFTINNGTGTQDLFNVTVNSSNFFDVGGTARVLGQLDLQSGSLRNGAIHAEGDVRIASPFNDNVDDFLDFSFTGGNNQVYTNNGGANTRGNWAVNKTAGTTVTAATSLNLQTDQSLSITSGTLYLNNNSNLTTGSLNVGANGKLVNESATTITLGGNLVNSGAIDLQGGGAICPENDTILIRSSTSTQRSWTGNGRYRLVDVDVQNISGTGTKNVFSGTNSGGNNASWIFNPNCPTALSITPSTASIQTGTTQTFTAGGGFAPYAFSILTNNSGAAISQTSGVYTAGTTAGVTDTIRVTDAFGATSDATVNVIGAASQLTFIAQPEGDTIAGQIISPPIQVAVQDESGNTITNSTAAITLSFFQNTNGATLSGTVTRNAVSGIAVFNNLSVDKANTYNLRATAGSLSGVGNPLFIVPGAPNRIIFVTQPTNTFQSRTINPSVKAAVVDSLGNAIQNPQFSVTIGIGNNAGGGALLGNSTRGTLNGVAEFLLAIDKPGIGCTLTASVSGLPTTTSNPFDVINPFLVTNTNDSGIGSLRQAITNVNNIISAAGLENRTIVFNIPGSAPYNIVRGSQYPFLGSGASIDGTTQPGFAGTPVVNLSGSGVGLVLSGSSTVKGLIINSVSTAILESGTQNRIQGNHLSGGSEAINSRGFRTIIGGSTPTERNIISNSGAGISLDGANETTVIGNYIGTDPSGLIAQPNNIGISILGSSGSASVTNTIIGGDTAAEENLIAFNRVGITVSRQIGTPSANIKRNSIHSNARPNTNQGLGIDLLSPSGVTPNDPLDADAGANGLQNFPVLDSASSFDGTTTVSGSLNSVPGRNYTLNFYSNPACDLSGFGEGETFIGAAQVTTDAGGIAGFTTNFPVTTAVNRVITATATDSNGNTSEFSRCSQPVAPAVFSISGRIADSSNNPISGVVVRVAGTNSSFVSDSNGLYSLGNIPGGTNLTLVPSKTNHTFAPASLTFNNLSANQTNQNFVGTAARFQINGRVTSLTSTGGTFSLPGVTLTLSGAASATATSDNFGNYFFNNLLPGTYTVTPSKPNHNFNPALNTVTIDSGSRTANFTATGLASLSGRIIWDNYGTGIEAINADGSGLTTVFPFVPRDVPFIPSLSPNGSKIVFFNAGGSQSEIGRGVRTVNFDGSSPSAILSPALGNYPSSVWSPNSDQIGFITRIAESQPTRIFKMNQNGSNRTIVAPLASNSPSLRLDWSPDGTKFAFSRSDASTSNRNQIFAVNTDGTNVVRLTSNNFFESTPRWSPDGSRIAFIRSNSSGAYSIVIMNADGSSQNAIYSLGTPIMDLDWSPDGLRLAFVVSTGFGYKLRTIQTDGTSELTIRDDYKSYNLSWARNNTIQLIGGAPLTVRSGFVDLTFAGANGFSGIAAGDGTEPTVTIEPVSPQSLGTSPGGFAFSNLAYEISTQHATLTAPVTLCLTIPNNVYTTADAFAGIAILQKTDAGFNDITTSRDFSTRRLCGESSTLGSFVIAEQIAVNLPRISGLILDNNGNPISNVTVNLSGAEARFTQTDSNGAFSFVNLTAGGNYNVAPKQIGYLFTEYNRDFVNLTDEQTIVFTGTAGSFQISGQITDAGGSGLSNVTVELGGAAQEIVQTDANGNYVFTNVPADGSYTLTASNGVNNFSPATAFVDPLTSDAAGVNFQSVATAPTAASVTVGGRVTTVKGRGVARARVTLTSANGTTRTVQTNSLGYYRFEDAAAGETYIIVARHKLYKFENNGTIVTTANEDANDLNFTAF